MESLDQINLCLGRSVLYNDIDFHQHMPKSFYDQCFVVGGSFSCCCGGRYLFMLLWWEVVVRVVVVGGSCSCCCSGR